MSNVFTESARSLQWLLFALALVCSIYVLPRWADWNVNSRLDVALAVVEQGTLRIDDYYQNTGDYAFFEGHFYSDKAPGTSFLAIPLYRLFRQSGARTVTDALAARIARNPGFAATLDPDGKGLLSESVFRFSALIFITFVVIALPCAFLALLLFRLVYFWLGDGAIAFWVALAYTIATPALPYANNLYGHQLAAFLLVATFYLLFRAARGLRTLPYTLLAGLALGAVVVVEYQTALIAGALGLYAIYKLRSIKLIAGMCLAALPPILLAALYNFAIFHTPLPVGYLYSPLYSDLHHIGLISLTYPKPDALFELMFGARRGLFLISPWLLLAVPGLFFFARAKQWRAEFLVCVWSVVSFWMFNSSSAMWQGGFAIGPRYLLPMLPFLCLPIGFVLSGFRPLWARVVYAFLFVVSVGGVWTLTLGGQLFPQYQPNPWLEYSIPSLVRGDVARNFGMLMNLNGLASLAPLVILCGGVVALWWLQERRHSPPQTQSARIEPRTVSR